MRKYRAIPLLVMSTSTIISSIGYGSWIINHFEESPDFSSVACLAVAKIGSKKFTNISKAIESSKSGDTIEVIVPTNLKNQKKLYEINSNLSDKTITIPKGVTFVIPYKDGVRSDKKAQVSGSDTLNDVEGHCKTIVSVADGVTLVNDGVIEVGGVLISNGGGTPTGCTGGDFAELLLGDGSSLLNHGTINVFGLISEKTTGKSKLITKPGDNDEDSKDAQINMPMYWYDFAGGTALKNVYAVADQYKCFPLTDFYFENITIKSYFYYGSSVNSWINLLTKKFITVYGESDLPLISKDNSGLIQFTNDKNYLICDYDPKTMAMDMQFFDGCTFNNLVVDMKKATGGLNGVVGLPDSVTTEKGYFPVSFHYNVSLNSSDSNLAEYLATNTNFKIMNGSSLMVGEKTKFSVKSLVCYEDFDYFTGNAFPGTRHPNLDNGKIVNNGEIYASSVGGTIKTYSDNSIFKVTGDTTLKMYEAKSASPDWLSKEIKLQMADANGDMQTGSGVYNSTKKTNEDYYWTKTKSFSHEITGVSIGYDRKSSDEGKKGVFNLTANVEPIDYESKNIEYHWSVKDNQSGATIKVDEANPQKVVVETEPNTNDKDEDIVYTIQLEVTFTKSTGEAGSVTSSIELTATDTCLLPTANVLMADGSFKAAGLIRTGDMVMSFNHETGRIEPNLVIGNDHQKENEKLCRVVHLMFSDGLQTDFLEEHGYFDLTLNRYVYLHPNDCDKYIGHKFVSINKNLKISGVELLSFDCETIVVKPAAPATAKHLNLIVDNMLALEGGLDGLFNIFDYDPETLAFDKVKMNADIKKYGLLSYKDFERFFPKEIYDLLPCKYLGVSIGKGLITWKIFESYVNKWKDQLMENLK